MKTVEREDDDRVRINIAQTKPLDFAELYERNFDRIYAFIARRVGSRDQAQDLTAEVFHQASLLLEASAGKARRLSPGCMELRRMCSRRTGRD